MTKQEYLKNRFLRDFLQYSLLQEDSLPAKEIAEKLCVAISVGDFMKEGERQIDKLIANTLSPEKLKVEGKWSNELPEEFDFELKNRILAQYNSYLESFSTEELARKAFLQVEHAAELQAWSNGVVNMPQAIDMLIEQLRKMSENFWKMVTPAVSDAQLVEHYVKAKEQTLLERVQHNNVDDIAELRNALTLYVRERCENMLCAKVRGIYATLAESEALISLQKSFEQLFDYAEQLKTQIVDAPTNEQWDAEYNHLVPIDFYHRNVADISAEQAFQMILLQFFARNEEWMTTNGLLSNGELRVYANPTPSSLSKLLSKLLGE